MMKKVIVDTNIIFKALRSRHSQIRNLLHHSGYSFFAPNFIVVEIFKHKERIVRASKVTEDEVLELLEKVLQNIKFVNEEFIGTGNLIHAHKLCSDIDEKDTLFVALTLELEGSLWTEDRELKNGLKRKGFDQFFKTEF
jgi:predicted nucleic acid-binding protein